MTPASLSDQWKEASRLEKPLLLRFLERSFSHYEKCWTPVDEACGFFGEIDPKLFNMGDMGFSSPVIEYVVRPHLQILLCTTVLIRAARDKQISAENEARHLRYLREGLLWACRTHLTGDLDVPTFLRRKRWGENWNSSLWASALAMTACFGREYLDPSLLEAARRVVAFEADRFVDTLPPNGRRGDSKAEETARDTMLLAWALALCPDHANATQWEETLRIYALNVASTVYDHGEFTSLDGQAINSFIHTVTLHPDYTLESHGFFHPEFLSYTQWIMVAVLAFLATGRKVPEYFVRPAHDRVSELFLTCCLSNGCAWPVGGQDWPLWMLRPYSFAYGLWRDDRIALRTMLNLLSLLAELQDRIGDGRFIPGLPPTQGGWGLTYESQIGFELALLALTPFPDDLIVPSPGRFERAQEANNKFPYVQTLIRRNGKTFRSFTWKNLHGRPTASFVLQSNPLLVGIAPDSLVGRIRLQNQKLTPRVLFHQEETFREGFETSGKIVYHNAAGGAVLSREMRILTWTEEGLLIFDRLKALCDVRLEREDACPLYIVNDEITGNRVNFVSGSLEESAAGPGDEVIEHVMPNNWVVVEDSVLYQLFWGAEKGLVYRDETERNQPPYWKNLRMDSIFFRVKPGQYAAGRTIRQLGIYVGAGKNPKRFKINGQAETFFHGLILMEGKNTLAL